MLRTAVSLLDLTPQDNRGPDDARLTNAPRTGWTERTALRAWRRLQSRLRESAQAERGECI